MLPLATSKWTLDAQSVDVDAAEEVVAVVIAEADSMDCAHATVAPKVATRRSGVCIIMKSGCVSSGVSIYFSFLENQRMIPNMSYRA